MHRESDKDYRYLLSRIIPRRSLSPARRTAVDAALAGGARLDCVKEAYLALEDLCALGEFRRDGRTLTERSALLTYRSTREAMRLSLVMSGDEWRSVTGRGGAGDRILPSVLAGIISSLALNDSPKTIVGRVEEVLALARHIVEGARGKLLFVNTVPSIREWPRDSVAFLPQNEALKRGFYRDCLTGSAPHTLVRLAGSLPEGSVFDMSPGAASVLLIPLLARDIRWAVLEVHLPVESLDAASLSSFHLLGQGIVRLVENNRHLEKMVSIDRLTRVHNRNYYEMQLPLEIERANRSRSSFAFLIIDIDDFKKVNDTYGHETGDGVLRLVAQTVRRSLRRIDLIFRYGGEEFVIILPGAGADSARRTAERIRGVVARAEHAIGDGRKVKVTISVGGCIYPESAQNESQLLRVADKALYDAKEEGKNRVVFSGE